MSIRRKILLAFELYQTPIDVQEAVVEPMSAMNKTESEEWLSECLKVVESGDGVEEMVKTIKQLR